MAISAGTYTIGAGGDYALLSLAIADIASNLTGDLTFIIIGDSIEPAAQITKTFGSAFLFTIRGNVPLNGDTVNGVRCQFDRMSISIAGAAPQLALDNVYLVNAGQFTNFGPSGASSIYSSIKVFECLFDGKFGINACGASAAGSASRTYEFCGNKFRSDGASTHAFDFALANSGQAVIESVNFRYENNSALLTGGVSSSSPVRISFLRGSGPWHINSFSVKNMVSWVNDSSQRALILTDNGTPLQTFYSDALVNAGNARNAGADTFSWSYSGITSPADILDLDYALAHALETNLSSVLATTGGAVPDISFNPWDTAPYLVGLYFADEDEGSLIMPAFVPGL